MAGVGSAEPMDAGSEAAALGTWQYRERITSPEGPRVSWTRHLARKPFVIEGYGLADESQLRRV